MSTDILKYFANYIAKEIGVVYQESDLYQLEMRLENFQKLKGYHSIAAIYMKFSSGQASAQELQEFLELATNNETSFFRDATLFRALKTDILPRLCKSLNPGTELRLWSAASSTGQEAYSLAMTLDELSYDLHCAYTIFCTDFNEKVLQRAREGIYNAHEMARGLTPDHLSRYFVEIEDKQAGASRTNYRIDERLRAKLSFSQLNLLTAFPSTAPHHIVFLRNVLIYQDVENRKKIISRLKEKITSGGILVLGATENLIGIDEVSFTQTNLGGAVVYLRNP